MADFNTKLPFLSMNRIVNNTHCILIFGVLSLSCISCKKLKELTEFDISYKTKVVVAPTFGINTPFEILTPDITTNSESEFASRGTGKNYIDKINLSSMVMKITSPSTQRFDFLKSIEISISASGLSDLKIAQKLDIPDNVGNEVALDVLENDIAEYIKKDKFKLRVNVVSDKTIVSEVQIDVNSVFRVKAKLF